MHQCGRETWFGWSSGTSVGAISAIFKGSGVATLTFGNCWGSATGDVIAYLNSNIIGNARHGQNITVTFDFSRGDILTLAEYNTAIIKLYNLEINCNGQ